MKTESAKQLYEFTKDDALTGKKKGDKISLTRVSDRLKELVQPVSGGIEDPGEVPTEKNTKAEILVYLHAKGVEDVSEQNTKEELLKAVKKVSK